MRLAILALSMLTATGPTGGTKADNARPFLRVGEELTYKVSSQRLGSLGEAVFAVKPADLNGHPTFEISFDFTAKVAFFKVSDHTRSWICSESMSMLRYTKQEKSPLGGRSEDVVVNQGLGQWQDGKTVAPLASVRPLDELSFIYLVRGLDLLPGESIELRRHFDVHRNPVQITALARQVVDGHNVVVYEMRVPDPRQKKGTSTLRFFISDDAARLPIRIESTMPVAGQVTMNLAAAR